MDKLQLPIMGERTWFNMLVKALSTLDGRMVEDGFNRDYVLMDGLSRPNGQSNDFGIDHFKIGDLNIVFGWGSLSFNLKQYQSGKLKLPYVPANYRCVVGSVYTWDGNIKIDSIDNDTIAFTPNTDVNGTFNTHFIMMWSDN